MKTNCNSVDIRRIVAAATLVLSLAVTDQVGRADDLSANKDVANAADLVGPRALSKAFRSAARRATPSVVTIYTYGQAGRTRTTTQQQTPNIPGLPGAPRNQTPKTPSEKDMTGIGSGVIVGEDGLIITNNHVITGAKRVVVHLSDETEITASVFRGDPDSDVGMLRIERDSPFQAAGVGDSDALEVGDWVLSIGSPFQLEATVSAGIISAKNRPLNRIKRGRMLQTDAAINPGNSGGPLIDLDGNVIGISTAIATRNGGYQGIGFAIPINHAKWIADELDQHDRVRRAAIGATLLELNPKYAKLFKKPAFSGVLVYQVIENSAAKRAGIQPLDVIIKFAGERVRSPETLQEVIERTPVGSFQDIVVKRGEDELSLQVELATVEDPTQKTSNEDADEKEEDKDDQDSDETNEASAGDEPVK